MLHPPPDSPAVPRTHESSDEPDGLPIDVVSGAFQNTRVAAIRTQCVVPSSNLVDPYKTPPKAPVVDNRQHADRAVSCMRFVRRRRELSSLPLFI